MGGALARSGLVGIGFDPGIASPGITVVGRFLDDYEVLFHKVVRSKASELSDLERYAGISPVLFGAIIKFRPSFLVFEIQSGAQAGAFAGKKTTGKSHKTSITVGIAIAAAHAYRLDVVGLYPQQIASAVMGPRHKGKVEKADIQAAVKRITGEHLPQDAADACASVIAAHQLTPMERHKGAA